MNSNKELFTIGHSNHSIDDFIALLQKHGITAIADVRSRPYSRYLPHFNYSAFKAALSKAGIHYVFLGQQLGARPDDPSCYVKGKALYEKIAATESFSQGIQHLLKGLDQYRISLMCAEKDPITCHRSILVCYPLRKSHLEINHILSNGGLASHQNLEEQLLSLHKLNQPEPVESEPKQLSLFEETHSETNQFEKRSREERIEEAYKRQANKIAYTEKRDSKINE